MKTLVKRIARKAIRLLAPDLANWLERYEYIQECVVPEDLKTKNRSTYVPTDFIGHDGINMHTDEQIELLQGWKEVYPGVFKDLRNDPEINTDCLGKNYVRNGYYATPDAEIYAAMILDNTPSNIIEVGAGFSTIIARKTSRKLDNNCSITVIDPEPRTDIENIADSIIYKRVEDVELGELTISGSTLLFIDSSHITRSSGDIPRLYNEIIPSLPSGALVHVHDIFIPYDYPFQYQERLYTEQYVLQALLCHSSKYRVVFAAHYMSRLHANTMQEVFGDVVGQDDRFYGCSLWFTVN